MFPAPPRPLACITGSRDRERDRELGHEPVMFPAPPRPNDGYRNVSLNKVSDDDGNSTYHASDVGFVDPIESLAIVSAAKEVGSRAERAGASGVSMHGVARGRENVSSPATTVGNVLVVSMHQGDVILWR
jgi:hypothetical protein